MDPVHQKHLRKFLKKYRHIRHLEDPGDRAIRALCMGLDHLVVFLKKDVCFKEYSAITVRWIGLISEIKQKVPTSIFKGSLEQISMKYIDLLLLKRADKPLLNSTLQGWSKLLETAQPKHLREMISENVERFASFSVIVFQLGNYYSQLLAMEVLSRHLVGFDDPSLQEMITNLFPGERLARTRELMAGINFQRFDTSVRTFLNTYNDSFDNWSVYTVNADYGKLENYNMVPPVDEQGHPTDLWIDFNFRDFSITFFCDGKTFGEKHSGWTFIEIEKRDIQDIQFKKVSNHLEISFFLNEKTALIFGENNEHKFQRLKFAVALNSTTEYLINKIFPKFADLTFKTYHEITDPGSADDNSSIPTTDRKYVKPIKRHQQQKLARPLVAPVIPEEDDHEESAVNQGVKKIAHLFPTQKTTEFSAFMSDCNSTFTFDDRLTNFDTMDGYSTDNEEDNEVIQATPNVSMKSYYRSTMRSKMNDAKSMEITVQQLDENKENIPPPHVVGKGMSGKNCTKVPEINEQRIKLKDVTTEVENVGQKDKLAMPPLLRKNKGDVNNNEQISSTVYLDNDEERVMPQPEIAREYEYDTVISETADSDVAALDDYSEVDMDVESPIRQVKTNTTQATYTVHRENPVHSEGRRPNIHNNEPELAAKNLSIDRQKNNDVFDFEVAKTEREQRKKSSKTPRGKSVNVPNPKPLTSKTATEDDKLSKYTYQKPQSMAASKNENHAALSGDEGVDTVVKTVPKKGKGANPTAAQIRAIKKEAVEKPPKRTPKPKSKIVEIQTETRPRSARTQKKKYRFTDTEEEAAEVPTKKRQKSTVETETAPKTDNGQPDNYPPTSKPACKTKPAAKNTNTAKPIVTLKKTTAHKLFDQVQKRKEEKSTAPTKPDPTGAKVTYDYEMMNSNWLMKKFIDSSRESSDFDQFENMSTNSGSGSNNDVHSDEEDELAYTGRTFTQKKVSDTQIYVQQTTTAPHSATVASNPITTTATTNSHTRCIATTTKRTCDESCDLVTTEIFQQNIKRTKFSTPKPKTVVFNVAETQKVVPGNAVSSSMDRRWPKNDVTGNDYTMSTSKKDRLVTFDNNDNNAIATVASINENNTQIANMDSAAVSDRSDFQLAFRNHHNTTLEWSNSFWTKFDDSIKTIHSDVQENSRKIVELVENNSKNFEESAQIIDELRKKEDVEIKKMRKLSDENKKLAAECTQFCENVVQLKEEKLQAAQSEYNKLAVKILAESNSVYERQWSMQKREIGAKFQQFLNDLIKN